MTTTPNASTSPSSSIAQQPMHAASVPVLVHMLGALKGVLAKGEAHATEHKIDPAVMLQARLHITMFPLVRQVQIATDFAKGIVARLGGAEVPVWADHETDFAGLYARIEQTITYLQSFEAAALQGSEGRAIVLMPGTARERHFDGQTYLLHYGLPQFFFHVTTAYDILRHHGVPVGKRDYMGVS
jgi:hypothetical protein